MLIAFAFVMSIAFASEISIAFALGRGSAS
jgi:hypothetical protein